MALDQSGFPLSQIEFSAMPTSTPNGFIKTGSGKKGVSTKEAEAQTRETLETQKAKEKRRKSSVKRGDGASSGYAGARCVDHLLAIIQTQEDVLTGLLADAAGGRTSSFRSSSSKDASDASLWVGL